MAWYGTREAGARNKTRRSSARRRAREKAAAGDERPLTLDEVYERDNGYCYLCSLPVAREEASIEHVTPLSKGGLDVPGNQRLAHGGCNAKKGARTGKKRKGLRRSMWRRRPKSRVPEDVDVF